MNKDQPCVWFTSDCHFGHANIIKYCNRPFSTVDEMDQALIANWNSVVQPNDTVYILGDMFLCPAQQAMQIMQQLKGKKYLIYGNHDKVIRSNQILQRCFAGITDILEQRFILGTQKYYITMCHYAMRVWNKSHSGSFHLYGHSHGKLDTSDTRSMDVGVDAHNMRPVSLHEVVKTLGTRPARQPNTDNQ